VENAPEVEERGSERVALLNNIHFISNELRVYVLSAGGWGWAIAWAQIGVAAIHCVAITDVAVAELARLAAHPALGSLITQTTVNEARNELAASSNAVLCCHLPETTVLEKWFEPLAASSDSPYCILLTAQTGRASQQLHDSYLGPHFRWNEIRHRHLGGLTSAKVSVGWKGPRPLPKAMEPRRRRLPVRPLERFLEPSVRLGAWRKPSMNSADVWAPSREDATAFPWPWKAKPPWVEAKSCFLGGSLVERPLTDKERAQLMDLREDWAPSLLTDLWEGNGGRNPPLRLLAETAIGAVPWIRDTATPVLEAHLHHPIVDWGRTRPPWVRDGGGDNDFLGWNWVVDTAGEARVATKADDAGVDLSLWAIGGDEPEMELARQVLRGFLLRVWKRRLCKEIVRWLTTDDARDEYQENLEAAQDCMRRCADAEWWEWSDGSRLLFWRWPVRWRTEARDGAKGFHLGTPRPRRHFPPIPVKEPWIIAKDLEKLEKLLRRRYVVPGKFVLAVPRFPVPKGADDIRVVWDLAKNGLNKEMFTPSFFLPTMATYLRRLQTGSYCGDFDIGEQFHNYQLHRAEQVYCGVDVPTELREKLRSEGMPVDGPMRWNRLVFGWQSSPYLALRMLARAIELAKGAPNETGSAFAWHAVKLNLPGSADYDPGIPRVVKLREDGTPATELVVFFDDGRVIGATERHAGEGIRQLTSRLQRLGNQDAARKRRPTSQRPGAWAGGIAYTDQGITRKMLSQTKWDRAKEFLGWIHSSISGGDAIGRQRFRSGKGFLVHVSQTYDFITPYLKGFHLSEDRWRSGRNAEGWMEVASEAAELDDEIENEDEEWGLGEDETVEMPLEPRAPDVVIPVPRLQDDVEVLLQFFAPVSPVQLIVRPVMGACYVAYGAGDASGEGFGSSIHPLGMEPLLRQGFWCTEDAEESSNWREFRNLLDAVQVESDAGRLVGRELWLATDNSTAAFAFSKGASKSRKLHEMVTQLRLMALRGNFVLNIFHISGTRMIQIGVDALSRGELHVGALGATETSAAPLHLSPVQRSPQIRTWVESWTEDNAKTATPEDWFHEAQQAGGANQFYQESQTWIWDLPPAAAIHALEELGNGRLKRHGVLRGVVLIPQLLQPEWSRRFTRVVDFYFVIPAGAIPAWPLNMHEPLTVGLFLPLLRHKPWCWRHVPFLVPLGRTLSGLYKAGDPTAGTFLRQFWDVCGRVAYLPERLVCEVLQAPAWARFLSLSAKR
jgi:hypothetical protein